MPVVVWQLLGVVFEIEVGEKRCHAARRLSEQEWVRVHRRRGHEYHRSLGEHLVDRQKRRSCKPAHALILELVVDLGHPEAQIRDDARFDLWWLAISDKRRALRC